MKDSPDERPTSARSEDAEYSLIQLWIIDQKVNFGVLGLFIILTLIAAWPVVSNLDGVIIGKDNDTYINPWADWWTAKALSNPNVSLTNRNYSFVIDAQESIQTEQAGILNEKESSGSF